MKVKVTTATFYGSFDAELPENTTPDTLLSDGVHQLLVTLADTGEQVTVYLRGRDIRTVEVLT